MLVPQLMSSSGWIRDLRGSLFLATSNYRQYHICLAWRFPTLSWTPCYLEPLNLFSAYNCTELPTIFSLTGHASGNPDLFRHAGTFPHRLCQPVEMDFLSIWNSSVAQAVAEEVERQHHLHDWEHYNPEPRIDSDRLYILGLLEHDTIADCRRPESKTKKAQGRLSQDHSGNGKGSRRDDVAVERGKHVWEMMRHSVAPSILRP